MAELPAPAEPLTEEQIRAATIGEPQRLDGPIRLVDYDPAWPVLFETEAMRIRTALGHLALAVEHIGSTAVPGLPAKPIIDIDLVVADSADEDAYLPALVSAGYRLRVREPQWYEHRMFKGPATDVNLHVFGVGVTEHVRHLVFRDWLRSHPEDRDAYATRKRELAARRWRYVQNYADAKSEVVVEILRRAGCT